MGSKVIQHGYRLRRGDNGTPNAAKNEESEPILKHKKNIKMYILKCIIYKQRLPCIFYIFFKLLQTHAQCATLDGVEFQTPNFDAFDIYIILRSDRSKNIRYFFPNYMGEFASILQRVSGMRIKHIRLLLALTRKEGATTNSFSPEFGMTLGEFCTAYVMTRQRSSILDI